MASKGQIPSIYRDAITRYEEITGKSLKDPDLLNIRTVNDLKNQIETRNHRFNEFREMKHTLFNVLEGAMKPVEMVGNLAAGASSMAFPPSSLVFGAVTYLMNAAKGVTASYNAIQDLMHTLKDFTVRLMIYNREQISKELCDQLSDVLVILIDIFALSRKAMKGGVLGRLQKYGRNVLLGNDDAIRGAVGKLEKLTQTEVRLVGAETLSEVKGTRRAVREMNQSLTETHDGVATIIEMMSEKRERKEKFHEDKLKTILQPSTTATVRYNRISKLRVPGTGDWIKDESPFRSWLDKSKPILWVSGNPGVGKSFLSSNMIAFLNDQYPQGVQHPSHISVGYFFFKDDNPKTRSFPQALRDLAYQICQNDPMYEKYVATRCGSLEDIGNLESAWEILFAEFFVRNEDTDSSVFLVIDAIDESYHQELQEFLGLACEDIMKEVPSRIQLTMVGRPQFGDLISEAQGSEVPTIHVTLRNNSADIVHYIKSSMHRSSVLRRVSDSLRTEIVNTLSTGARGMFLWVDLILHELNRNRAGTEGGMRKLLNSAPKDLTKMFRHVLEGFSGDSTEDEAANLNELLAWTACAKRPLTLGELDAVLKLKDPEGQGLIDLEGALRKQFASFFTLARDDGLSTAELQSPRKSDFLGSDTDEDDTVDAQGLEDVESTSDFKSNPSTTEVTFCHASIRKFFRDEHESKVSAGRSFPFVGVDYNKAKVSVLKTCLEIFCNEAMVKKVGVGHSILGYAGNSWLEHLSNIDASTTSTAHKRDIAALLSNMLRKDTAMNIWAGYLPADFFVNDNIKTIGQWLFQEEIIISLPEDDQEWIRATKQNPATIFSPIANYVGTQWLEEPKWNPFPCCLRVYGYINLEKGTPLTPSFGITTAQDIVAVAKWSNSVETALWHRRLAMALRERECFHEAFEHFAKALELDPTMWMARAGMAIAHVMKKEFAEAVELDLVTEQQILESTGEQIELHDVQERMGACYASLSCPESSFDAYQRAYHNDPSCDTCISECLKALNEGERYKEVINMLKYLNTCELADVKCTSLTLSLINNCSDDWVYFRTVAKAAHQMNELDFLISSYRTAIKQARKELKSKVASYLEDSLARLYYEYARDQKKGVRSWEKVINTYEGSEDTQMTALKMRVSTRLAQHWLRKALEAGVGTIEAEDHIKELEKWTDLRQRDRPGGETRYSGVYVNGLSLLLGVWHRLNGRLEDMRACIQPSMTQAIQLLTDDYLGNNAVYELAVALMAAGDDDNYIALMHFLDSCYGSEEGTIETIGACSGLCKRRFPNFSSGSMCRYCFDVCFCDSCLAVLKEGRMQLDVCSPKHEFLRLSPATKKLEPGTIFVEGVSLSVEDWKKKLKEEWEL